MKKDLQHQVLSINMMDDLSIIRSNVYKEFVIIWSMVKYNVRWNMYDVNNVKYNHIYVNNMLKKSRRKCIGI